MPRKIIQINDIPRTKSGKIVELAVKNIIEGNSIKNKEALANPESLNQFKDIFYPLLKLSDGYISLSSE